MPVQINPVLLIITIILLTTANRGHSRLLYNSTDCVNILTEGNATQFLANGGEQGGLHLVLFYAGWCSHCRNMAPLFRQFLRRTKQAAWSRSLVDISAVACAEEDRRGKWSAVCSRFKITSVPTFRLLSPRPNGTDIGTAISPIIYNLAMFYPSVVKSISEYSANCSKSQLPAGWPHFAPLSFDQLIALLDSEDSQKTVVVVVEWPDSTTGREVMLRFGDGSLKSRQLSLYRTVYRSWEDAEILRWAPLLAEAGQLIPPFLLVMQGQQQHPKQFHFVLKPQDHLPPIKPEDEADYFGGFIKGQL